MNELTIVSNSDNDILWRIEIRLDHYKTSALYFDIKATVPSCHAGVSLRLAHTGFECKALSVQLQELSEFRRSEATLSTDNPNEGLKFSWSDPARSIAVMNGYLSQGLSGQDGDWTFGMEINNFTFEGFYLSRLSALITSGLSLFDINEKK